MLRGLFIQNMLIIDRLELNFQRGLNVLTGETGAGKSILLDSLGFVLGWRGRAELVRQGAETGEVSAWFDIPADHPVRAVLDEAGFDIDDELILRRVCTKEGRKTAYVNDRRASGQILRKISEHLVELHGQHDDKGLLNVKGHMDLLDTFADHADLISDVRCAWVGLSKAEKILSEQKIQIAQVAAEEEFLRYAVAELEKLAPEQGEEAILDSQRRMMQAAERIRDDVAKAHTALGQNGAETALGDATRWIEGAAGQVGDTLDPALSALSQAMAGLGEAQSQVERFLESLQFDSHELEMAEERLFAIRAMARKYDVTPDALATYSLTLKQKLEALDQGSADLAVLEKAVSQARSTYEGKAQKLSKSRTISAASLDKAMLAELAPLKMGRAIFETLITPSDAGRNGVDQVAFAVATNPGAPAGPLNKIASGGELSRFLLALKVCLSRGSSHRTMIFDEIDRGVGGATADAVGRRLKLLGAQGQVLVVTHSPQVAALGGAHWRVEKHATDTMTTSTVVPLSSEMRVEEIARMLAGDIITDAAKDAALALLAG